MKEAIRVALVGVGNCASSLVQGVNYYSEDRPGLISRKIGGYRPSDITFSAGFDVSNRKVGLRLDEAIFAEPNNTIRFAKVPVGDAVVHGVPAFDGIGSRYREKVSISPNVLDEAGVEQVLRATHTQIVVNYLPVGSKAATEWWAERALGAGCGFINCIPERIASIENFRDRFKSLSLPLIGDDVKSQVGATIVHRRLLQLMQEKGIVVDRTYQLNFGGNMDFYNMLNDERLGTKRWSKTNAVRSLAPSMDDESIHIGPSDFVSWLEDRKWCYVRIEGRGFGGAPLNLELKLEVWDSPNSAGVVTDVIRWCRVALDRGEGGAIGPVCAVYMKAPPWQSPEGVAEKNLEGWAASIETDCGE